MKWRWSQGQKTHYHFQNLDLNTLFFIYLLKRAHSARIHWYSKDWAVHILTAAEQNDYGQSFSRYFLFSLSLSRSPSLSLAISFSLSLTYPSTKHSPLTLTLENSQTLAHTHTQPHSIALTYPPPWLNHWHTNSNLFTQDTLTLAQNLSLSLSQILTFYHTLSLTH